MCKRLLEIGDEVVDVLETDGDSDERIRDSRGFSLRVREIRRGLRRGMVDEGLGAAEAYDEREHVAFLENGSRLPGPERFHRLDTSILQKPSPPIPRKQGNR